MTIRISSDWKPETHRRCPGCNRTLLLATDYYECPTRPPWTKGRWSTRCKECSKAQARQRYHADIEKSRASGRKSQAAYAARNRQKNLLQPSYRAAMERAAEARRAADDVERRNRQRLKAVSPRKFNWVEWKIKEWYRQKLAQALRQPSTPVEPPSDAPYSVWTDDTLTPAQKFERIRAENRERHR